MNIQPKAYSYIRFSSAQQASGDSLRRQNSDAQVYAAEHGLTLDATLNISDLGVSAFKGKNFAEGALGQFIKAVDDGRVKKGSFLLVEHLDRLSRLPVMDALNIFQEIIKRGISIVTLRDKIVYSKENLNANWTSLIIALASMSGANDESVKKSDRVGKAWQNKKQEARAELKPLGNNAPLWLDYISIPAPAYIINQERVDIVRRIFDLAISGHGKTLILKALNAESIPSFKGKTWGSSSLQKLLSNRAVIGEYQPHVGRGKDRQPIGAPIQGYYPPIISQTTFYEAQKVIADRCVAGATKQSHNFQVWQGIAKCLHCQSALHLVDKGQSPKGGKYLQCANARKGLCKAKAIRLDQSELVFKQILAKVDSLSLVQDSSASISRQIAAIEGRLSVESGKQVEYKAALKVRYSTTLDELSYECEQIISTLSKEKESLLLDLASETITDKEQFFSKLDLVSYEGRYRANALLKRLNIKVAIQRDNGDTTYIMDKSGVNVLGIISEASGRIDMLAFTDTLLDKVKSQDFDGSIESSIDMLISERMSDRMINGEWWSDATLDDKIMDMARRVDIALELGSEAFLFIKDKLDRKHAYSSPKLQEWATKAKSWIDSLDE